MNYTNVLHFWFSELTPQDWWRKSDELDAQIAQRFSALHLSAKNNELYSWRHKAKGALAEIIVLDQFSRNIFRGKPEAFAQDAQALALAQVAVASRLDQELEPEQRAFLYMPYMHSESGYVHEQAMTLFSGDTLVFEKKHKAIIDRFGRYPHRNKILGRVSTDEEMAFLQEAGSSF